MKLKFIIACLAIAFMSCGDKNNNGSTNKAQPGNYDAKADQNPAENSAEDDHKEHYADSAMHH